MAVTAGTLDVLKSYRLALNGIADSQTRTLVNTWLSGWRSIADELGEAVEAAAAGGVGAARRAVRLSQALDATAEQLGFLARAATGTMLEELPSAVELAGRTEASLIRSQLPVEAWNIVTDWDRVDQLAVSSLIRRTAGRINALSAPLSLDAARVLKTNLVAGLASGTNPVDVARKIMRQAEDDFNGGLARAIRLSRTELNDAMREASLLADAANKDVLTGWEWVSTLSERTCGPCWSMHGRSFDVEEPGPLGHPNCRCVRVPRTKTYRELGLDLDEPADLMPDAEDLFARLSADAQRAVLGPARYRAWARGDYPMSQWVRKIDNPDWRPSYRPTPPGYTGPTGAPPRPRPPGVGPDLDDVTPEDVPEWLATHRRLKAELDGFDKGSIGVTTRVLDDTAEYARQLANLEQRLGGSLSHLDDLVDKATARLRALEALDDAISRTPGISTMTKWPDELADLARAAGVYRRMPKNTWSVVYDGAVAQRNALFDLQNRARNLRRQIEILDAKRASGTLSRVSVVDDLDDLGQLGARSSEALDLTLAIGANLERELARRLAERFPSHFDPSAELYGFASARLIQRYRNVLRELLGEVRSYGAGGRSAYVTAQGKFVPVKGAPQTQAEHVVRALDEAHTKYPSEWNDLLENKRPAVTVGFEERGYNQGATKIVLSSRYRGGRADYTEMTGVATHELGHSMEAAVPGLRGLEWAFHYRRSHKVIDPATGRARLVDPEDIYGKDIGMGAELHIPDDWATAYVGKTYRGRGGLGAENSWEVFTMGAESLWDGSGYFRRMKRKPNGFLSGEAEPDTDYLHFMLGVLGGL